MSFKILIIEDEQRTREMLANMIESYVDHAEIIAEGDSIVSGRNAIEKHQPDLALLDVQLMDGTSFDMLRQLPEIDFKIIFVTAYEDYAIQAFKFSALDYILKPVDPEELVKAVRKVRDEHTAKPERAQLDLVEAMRQQRMANAPRKIILRTAESLHVVRAEDIVRCEADRNYTAFHFTDGKRLIVSRTLKEFDAMLTVMGDFFRIHQSHLVNLDQVDRLDKADGGAVVLKDGTSLPISQSRKEGFLAAITG